ncbi:MAG: P-type ATPase, partial [Alphaproteobacteria bacterium]
MTLAGSLDCDAGNATTSGEPAFDYAGYAEGLAGGEYKLLLLVEGVHCGGCIARIERALHKEPDVTGARLNLSTRRLTVSWQGGASRANEMAGVVSALGYRVVPAQGADGADLDKDSRVLLRSLAVAGFAAANVMLLSIAVWAGHSQGMGAATRDLLHWFSALVALPAIVYAGRPFFYSAARALRGWGTNMDVPISLAILLTSGMSLFETMRGGPDTYFDSAIALLFFLLVGRYLDSRARGKARETASRLMSLGVRAVTALKENGQAYGLPIEQVVAGMRLLVTSGERVPADGVVLTGRSEIDSSLISGETLPGAVGPGDQVYAGTMNIGAPL